MRKLLLLASASLLAITSASAQLGPVPSVPGVIGSDATTYFVRTDGNDANDCLVNSTARACLTIQGGFNRAIAKSHSSAALSIADGTYASQKLSCAFQPTIQFSGGISIVGNVSTPANVILDSSAINDNAVSVQNGCVLTISGVTLKAAGSAGSDLLVNTGATVYANNIVFNTATSMHMDAYYNGIIVLNGNTTITGNAVGHYHAHLGGVIVDQGNTVTITGTPAFSSFFAGVAGPGTLAVAGTTYSGAATGRKWLAHNNGFVDEGLTGCGANFFPGDSAGLTDQGSFGICDAVDPINYTFNSGLNAQEVSPSAAQNYYIHGTGGGGVRIGSGVWLGQMWDSTGVPTIASGACGATTNGTIAGDNMVGKITIGAAATATCAPTFSGTLPNAPHAVILTPANAAAAALGAAAPFISALSTAGFTFQAAALANTNWYYEVR